MSESPDVILHHYEMSPYARKVRLAFGLKGVAWRSVLIPIVMPKPDLTELTGGYRRTPVMQIGADIYCDTKRCMQELERRFPKPSLFPAADQATVWGLSRWAETSFMMAVTVFLGLGGTFDEAFIEDRKKMAPQVDFSQAPLIVPAKLLQLRANLDRLEHQLGDGRRFLLGDAPSLADLAGWHPHAFLGRHPRTAELLQKCWLHQETHPLHLLYSEDREPDTQGSRKGRGAAGSQLVRSTPRPRHHAMKASTSVW